MKLNEAKTGKDYWIREITSDDEELRGFLFSLGCYSGEPVTVVSKKKNGVVISVKDARYSMDSDLAGVIEV